MPANQPRNVAALQPVARAKSSPVQPRCASASNTLRRKSVEIGSILRRRIHENQKYEIKIRNKGEYGSQKLAVPLRRTLIIHVRCNYAGRVAAPTLVIPDSQFLIPDFSAADWAVQPREKPSTLPLRRALSSRVPCVDAGRIAAPPTLGASPPRPYFLLSTSHARQPRRGSPIGIAADWQLHREGCAVAFDAVEPDASAV